MTRVFLIIFISVLVSCTVGQKFKSVAFYYSNATAHYDTVIITNKKDLQTLQNSLTKIKPGIGIFKIYRIIEITKEDGGILKFNLSNDGSLLSDSSTSYHFSSISAKGNFNAVLTNYISTK